MHFQTRRIVMWEPRAICVPHLLSHCNTSNFLRTSILNARGSTTSASEIVDGLGYTRPSAKRRWTQIAIDPSRGGWLIDSRRSLRHVQFFFRKWIRKVASGRSMRFWTFEREWIWGTRPSTVSSDDASMKMTFTISLLSNNFAFNL